MDWVVTYRMRRGIEVGRRPNWLEIQEFMQWATDRGLPMAETARLARVGMRTAWRWKKRMDT